MQTEVVHSESLGKSEAARVTIAKFDASLDLVLYYLNKFLNYQNGYDSNMWSYLHNCFNMIAYHSKYVAKNKVKLNAEMVSSLFQTLVRVLKCAKDEFSNKKCWQKSLQFIEYVNLILKDKSEIVVQNAPDTSVDFRKATYRKSGSKYGDQP